MDFKILMCGYCGCVPTSTKAFEKDCKTKKEY